MRPQRLVMEGFLAYRERTEVDFTGADLFVLSGPTGAGKSSVIDGMIFALYGTIPRLDDRRSVAPVISARADRARISFEFTIGEETYTAVRLVERKASGASTTEARLLRGPGGEVLAGNADEVTATVSDLLGLGYEHFIKAVVLPQGAFADFLTDRPKDRQGLLRALLDLGLFEEVMQLANLRARASEAKAESMAEALAKLDVPTGDQLEEARSRLTALTEAAERLPALVRSVEEKEKTARDAVSAREALETARTRLLAVTVPKGLVSLMADRNAAKERADLARNELSAATAAGKEMDAAIAALPDRRLLESWQEVRERLAGIRVERDDLDLDGLRGLVEEAAAARDQARADLERMRVEHTAHGLRDDLGIGAPCPVCHVVVTAIPEPETGWDPGTIDDLSKRARELDTAASEARDRMKEVEGRSKQIERSIEELEGKLDEALTEAEVEGALTSVRELERRREEVNAEEARARLAVEEAEEELSKLGDSVTIIRDELHSARDSVSDESPPLPGDDVIEGWRVFAEWREARVAARASEIESQTVVAVEATTAADLAVTELHDWLERLGIEAGEAPTTELALAIERHKSEVRELEKAMTDAAVLTAELETETGRALVASSLGTHLRANNFERWLLEEAMGVLIDGANSLLADLSGGSYSLLARDSQFEVVDHRNARLTRTARSLSGGETFLVSLSLALSMAEQLAELTGVSSRLESVFLDEGFGSLDQESLDVVASVLDELVGRGRTVGIVTHVRELADRIPVRYEVTKGPETSAIERVGE